MENTAQKTPHITTKIGTINVKTATGFARVHIAKAVSGFIAAARIDGSIWFDTGTTGIAALLQLAGRLEGIKQQ